MGRIRLALNAIIKDRKELGRFTQQELADSLHCTQPAISQYLSGESVMSDEIIEGFCDYLGIKFSDLESWNPELADIRFKPAPALLPVCQDNNADHISYHEWLEDIFHRDATPKKKWANGIMTNIEAMRDKAIQSGGSSPKGEHGPGRPANDLGPGVPVTRKNRKKA
jgi:transcriptional regulator with XRE-family HTH domain